MTLARPCPHRGRRRRRGQGPVGPAPDHRRCGQLRAVPSPTRPPWTRVRIPADIIVVAIGQGIEIQGFDQAGVPITSAAARLRGRSVRPGQRHGQRVRRRRLRHRARHRSSGPSPPARWQPPTSTSTWAIHHEIRVDVEVPAPRLTDCPPHGPHQHHRAGSLRAQVRLRRTSSAA